MKDIRYTAWIIEDSNFKQFYELDSKIQFVIRNDLVNFSNPDFYLNFTFMDKIKKNIFQSFMNSSTIYKNYLYLIQIMSDTHRDYMYRVNKELITSMLENKNIPFYVKILNNTIVSKEYTKNIIPHFLEKNLLYESAIAPFINLWKDFGFVCACSSYKNDLDTTNNIKWFSFYDLLLKTNYLNYFLKNNKRLLTNE